MTELFDSQTLPLLNRKIKRLCLLSGAGFILIAGLCVLFGLLNTEANHLLLLWSSLLLSILGGWGLLALALGWLKPAVQLNKLLSDAFNAPRRLERGRVESVSDQVKTYRGQAFYEVVFQTPQGPRMVNWLWNTLPSGLVPGRELTVESGLNIALSYKLGGADA